MTSADMCLENSITLIFNNIEYRIPLWLLVLFSWRSYLIHDLYLEWSYYTSSEKLINLVSI